MRGSLPFRCAFVLGIFAAFSLPAAAQSTANPARPKPSVMLGVLEDVPTEYGEPNIRAVRAVFQKLGDEWVAFPTQTQSDLDLASLPSSYPKQVIWTIAHQGQNLGTVTAESPAAFASHAQIGIQQITSEGPVPTIGEKSAEYSGFRIILLYQPLVAVSLPNVSDPDSWKTAQPAAAAVAAARRLFHSRFPRVMNCQGSRSKQVPALYTDDDIKVLQAFTSPKAGTLLKLSLLGWSCEGVADYGGPYEGQWYAVLPKGDVAFLGSDMALVDAGDYDNDGSSELLFTVDGYNSGGYRLFYRNFSKGAEFTYYFR